MSLDNNTLAFLELMRAGLWEKEARLSKFGKIDYASILQLAEEQSVVGLVTAGLEHVSDVKVPQEWVLQFVGETLQIEEQNRSMNEFIADIVGKMRNVGVYTLLVKGQGVAQCYARPLWRSCGDVDFFLSEDNYKKAKDYLIPLSSSVEEGSQYTKHLGMTIDNWEVELHGNLRSRLFKSIDDELDSIMNDTFCRGNVRSWLNGRTQIFLPGINNDVVYVFTHILQHFFKGGIGLRQVCDWCRLLWTYRDSLNHGLLESRIKTAGLMSEWKAFAALAVNWLGIPVEAMPFYSGASKWHRKGNKTLAFVMETGNFGHNRDMSYRQDENAVSRKWKTFYHITADTIIQFSIFPADSVKVWWRMMGIGLKGSLWEMKYLKAVWEYCRYLFIPQRRP